jgi:aspartate/methionine/tyrosine aminotransferase
MHFKLSIIGDPTIFGNLKPHDVIIEAVQNALKKMKFNGYAPTVGYQESRSAVAEYYTTSEAVVTPNVRKHLFNNSVLSMNKKDDMIM